MKDEKIQKLAEITNLLLFSGINDLSKTKWNKLLFFIDSAYFNSPLGNKEKTLTECEYIKMPYGPMINNFQYILSYLHEDYNIKISNYIGYSAGQMTFIEKSKNSKLNLKVLEKKESVIVESVAELFGKYNAAQLSEFSHMLDAWSKSEMFTPIDFSLTIKDSYIKKNSKKNNIYELIFGK